MIRRRPGAGRRQLLVVLAMGAGGCVTTTAGPRSPTAALEAWLDSTRYLADQVSVTESRGADRSAHGIPLADLLDQYRAARALLRARLGEYEGRDLSPADRGLVVAAESAFRHMADPDHPPALAAGTGVPDCRYDPAGIAIGDSALLHLETRVFACYGDATRRIIVDRDTLDRLSVLGLLGTTGDRARRERLFRGLDTVWNTINGHDEPGSPYRRLLELRRAAWGGASPVEARSRVFGIPSPEAEAWLERLLAAWSATLDPEPVEPWDYYYRMGAASRRLAARIPRDSLLALNRRFYRSLGADPEALNVHFDIEARAGKYPVAFTNFGARAVERGGRWIRGEPWVFASYRGGGLDNLNELLHETGHAVHIAAIRARPAWHDWPDSDTFTEAIAELATQEMFEPGWQNAFLGAAAPLEESLRAKYAGIMMDVAWALFEFRVHRAGAPSPNTIWTEITSRYFRIKPHPEWSWWAMRGQLIENPGYLLNYGLGAVIAADLRQALIRRYGPFTTGRPGWYREVSGAIYRYGLARPSQAVMTDVLGRLPTPDALMEDLGRIKTPEGR